MITRSRAIKQEITRRSSEPEQEIEQVVKMLDIKPIMTSNDTQCCICYRELNDPARLDCCNHTECFLCLKSWLGVNMSCCVCRAVPKEFIIRLRGPEESRKYPVAEIAKEKLREERERAAASVPLTSERAIMRRAKHEYQLEIERINNENTHPGRVYRKKCRRAAYQKRMADKQYSEMVDSLNALSVILDETSRQTVISNPHFRRLIYKYNCEWFSAAETTLNRGGTYSPRYARENEDMEKARILPFIIKELDNVHYKNMCNRKLERRNNMAETIFNKMKDIPIQAPHFVHVLDHQCLIKNAHAKRIQQEIFNFAASGLSEDDYYTISCYRLPGIPTPANGQEGVLVIGGLRGNRGNPEVVTIDDDEDDDDIRIEHEQINVPPNESNFLQDDPMSSGSERDALFQRRACRIPPRMPTFPLPTMPHAPPFLPGAGISYSSILQNRPTFEGILGNGFGLDRQFGSRVLVPPRGQPIIHQVFDNRAIPSTAEINVLSSPEQSPVRVSDESAVVIPDERPPYEPTSPVRMLLPSELSPPGGSNDEEAEADAERNSSNSERTSHHYHHRTKLEKYGKRYQKEINKAKDRGELDKLREELNRLKEMCHTVEQQINGTRRRSARTSGENGYHGRRHRR